MGIDLYWKGESGNELADVGDPQMLLSRHVGSSAWNDTVCLRFIDPYGNTVFNRQQASVLIDEFEASLSGVEDPTIRDHVQRVIALLHRVVEDVHTYAWFIGD